MTTGTAPAFYVKSILGKNQPEPIPSFIIYKFSPDAGTTAAYALSERAVPSRDP